MDKVLDLRRAPAQEHLIQVVCTPEDGRHTIRLARGTAPIFTDHRYTCAELSVITAVQQKTRRLSKIPRCYVLARWLQMPSRFGHCDIMKETPGVGVVYGDGKGLHFNVHGTASALYELSKQLKNGYGPIELSALKQ